MTGGGGAAAGVKIYKDGKHGGWNLLPWFDEVVSDMDQFFRDTLTSN